MSTIIQNKLLQYAPEPPEKVWEAISNALDENTGSLKEKLYQFEELPPSRVWDTISQQLSNHSPARAIPLTAKYSRVMRYAGATAAILLAAAVTISLFTGKKTESAVIATTQGVIQNRAIKTDSSGKDLYSTSNDLSARSFKPDKIDNPQNPIEERKAILNRLRPQLNLGSVALAFIPRVAKTKQTVGSDMVSDKYMVYSDGDGNAMKLPKKLFDFIACVKEDIRCKQEMQQLQQKFAIAPLTTDFTGVLEILKNLKENQ